MAVGKIVLACPDCGVALLRCGPFYRCPKCPKCRGFWFLKRKKVELQRVATPSNGQPRVVIETFGPGEACGE